MAAYEEVTTDSHGNEFTAESFLSHFRKTNRLWWQNEDDTETCAWVFRGHRDSTWKLIPSAFRSLDNNTLTPLVERIKRSEQLKSKWFLEKPEEFRNAAYRYVASYLAIRDFYKLSLEIGLTDELVNLDDPYGLVGMNIRPDGDREYYKLCSLQILGLAQHHGIPTPFLDWTRKPEVAVHFATEIEDKDTDEGVAVYALNSGNIQNQKHPRSPENILSGYVVKPEGGYSKLPFSLKLDAPAKNSYLAAQHGIFTIMDSLESFFATGVCPPLEEAVLNWPDKNQTILKKFILPRSEVKALRFLLDREGITEAHLKPSFDSIAALVKSRWRY